MIASLFIFARNTHGDGGGSEGADSGGSAVTGDVARPHITTLQNMHSGDSKNVLGISVVFGAPTSKAFTSHEKTQR